MTAVTHAAAESSRRRRTVRLLVSPRASSSSSPLPQSASRCAGASTAPRLSSRYVPPGRRRPPCSGQASDQETPHGWQVKLAVKGLPDLGETGFYECWYLGKGDRPGHPNRVSAGTFNVDSQGRADVRMSGWADPRHFTTMQITREPADGNPASSGDVVLQGSVRI